METIEDSHKYCLFLRRHLRAKEVVHDPDLCSLFPVHKTEEHVPVRRCTPVRFTADVVPISQGAQVPDRTVSILLLMRQSPRSGQSADVAADLATAGQITPYVLLCDWVTLSKNISINDHLLRKVLQILRMEIGVECFLVAGEQPRRFLEFQGSCSVTCTDKTGAEDQC